MCKKYIKDCVDSIFSILPYYDAVSIIMGDKTKSFDVLYSKSLSDFLVQLQNEVDKNKDTFVITEVIASGDIVDGSNLENDYFGYGHEVISHQ